MTDDGLHDTSDPKQVAKAVKTAKGKEVELREALRLIMGSEPGRRWVHDLLKRCAPYANPFRDDPLRTAFACGEMNIGQQLIVDLHACSTELYLQMMKENQGA